jgi:hypothetical protein
MILAEDELAIGTDHDGIMELDDDLVPGTPLADVLPISTEVLELEITPNRPGLPGRLRRRARGPRRHGRAAGAAAVERGPGRAGDVAGVVGRACRRPTVPALHGAPVRGRDHRSLAGLAEGPADGAASGRSPTSSTSPTT